MKANRSGSRGPDDLVVLEGAAVVPRRARIQRRRGSDSQTWRAGFQLGFLLLNLLIGAQFYVWVRHFETGGEWPAVLRPPGVEGWLPIASLMNLKAWILTGRLPDVHPAGVFLIVAFMACSFWFRKAFCGWLCPVGTVSETLAAAGRRLLGRNLKLPRWLDVGLRSLKYVLLGLFLYVITVMSVAAIRSFLDGPYGIVADVKMLDFFRRPSLTTLVVVAALMGLSTVVQGFWCRYLCPYGALMGLLSWFSPAGIRREAELCIDCAKCTKACPARLPVHTSQRVRSPECLGCLQCVEACPSAGALEMKFLGRRLSPGQLAAGIAVMFLGAVLVAQISGHWHTDLPRSIYFELIPAAHQLQHP